jgi:hypothetical protein
MREAFQTTDWVRVQATASEKTVAARYYERVMRNDDETLEVIRYILENPVRARLTVQLGEYPFAGSDVYSWPALFKAWEPDKQT